MDDRVYNVAEATKHRSDLVERVEYDGFVASAETTPQETLAQIDAVRERIRERRDGKTVLKEGEAWRDLVDEGRPP